MPIPRIVSVGDDFALPAGTKVLDSHLPARLGATELSATYATKGELADLPTGSGTAAPLAKIPLDIPTYDGNPNVTHPSVVYVPEGWNGWKYWMAHTPYPDAGRENPCLYVSQDGANWEEPEGLTNPFIPISEAQADGYSFHADGHLTLLPNGTMWHTWKEAHGSPAKQAIYRKQSTDGITWTNKTRLQFNTTREDFVSPALEIRPDGTYGMWGVDALAPTLGQRLKLMTSTDGNTFAAPVDCTLPAGLPALWHIDVKIVGGIYHLLANCDHDIVGGRIYYLTSTDGLNWTGEVDIPAIPATGYAFDARSHYRSCFVPMPGDPIRWDVWLSGQGVGNVDWRIALLKNITLPNAGSAKVRADIERERLGANTGIGVLGGDGFNRADSATSLGSAVTGQVWTAGGGGVMGIQAGKAYAVSNSRHWVETGLADVDVSLDFEGSISEGWIVFRATDDNNWWRFGPDRADGRIIVQKRVAGTITSPASMGVTKGFVTRPGDRLRVVAKGNVLTFYRNNQFVLTLTDSFNSTATKHGIGSTPGTVRLDNFTWKAAP